MKIESDFGFLDTLAEVCRKNGICFVDVASRFQKEYAEKHLLPYGFANTSVGNGHMNKYGHMMFAEEIYALIQSIEHGNGGNL